MHLYIFVLVYSGTGILLENLCWVQRVSCLLQTPKSTLEIGKLNVDISKVGGSESNLFVRVQILPIVVHIGDPQVNCDQLSKSSAGGCSVSSQGSVAAIEKSYATFLCEKFSISCEFGHDRYFSSFYSIFIILILHLL